MGSATAGSSWGVRADVIVEVKNRLANDTASHISVIVAGMELTHWIECIERACASGVKFAPMSRTWALCTDDGLEGEYRAVQIRNAARYAKSKFTDGVASGMSVDAAHIRALCSIGICAQGNLI